MNGYKLKRLYIENFKLVTKREIDFDSLDLMILDGPNGYGKTTIYDALELLLSKKISRIEDNDVEDNRHAHQDSLFAKEKSNPILIKGEFLRNNGESIVLAIHLPANENSKSWDNYKQYQLGNFGQEISEGTELDNFDNILGLTQNKIELKNDFKNFYYIQQENNTHFFKKSEKDRIQVLSKFFGTEDAEELKRSLNEKLLKIKDLQKKIKAQLKEKNEELNELTKQSISVTNKDVKFISLHTESTWDNEEFIPSNKEKLKEINDEIDNFSELLKHINSLKKYLNNEEYKSISGANADLKRFVVLEHFKDQYKDFKKLVDQEIEYSSIKKNISERDYEAIKKIDFKPLFQKLGIDDFEKKVQDIDTLKSTIDRYINESGAMSDLARVINDTRKALLEKYKKFEDSTKEDGICPLCGYDGWENFEKLEEEFQKKKAFFEEFKDEKATKATELQERLFSDELLEIAKRIDSYLSEEKHIIAKEFFKQLENQYIDIEKHNVYVEKLKKNALYDELLNFVNNNQMEVNDLDPRIHNIIQVINGRVVEIEDTEFFEQKANILSAFNILKKSFAKIENINHEKIKQKKEWLAYKYYTNEEARKAKIQNSVKELEKKFDLLKKLIVDQSNGVVKNLHDTLDQKIKEQWKNVIKQIEIPLYIYSGKILQDTQRGNGIFIEYDTSKKNSPLKFLSTLESDYDATFSMSTGQLSALVVSLTLALNKVYGMNRNGGMLLIDDPMQSMDEMNIASFIELIRNDFSDTQFILSTHESKISRLLQYKYLKYNKNVRNYSVKNEFFNEDVV